MGVCTTWQLKKIRNRMFKDLERVINARNTVVDSDMSNNENVRIAIMVAKKIEEFAKYYAHGIGLMNEQLELVESNNVDIDKSRFLSNYKALKEDTQEVVDVMFEMYEDVYNKIKEWIDNE